MASSAYDEVLIQRASFSYHRRELHMVECLRTQDPAVRQVGYLIHIRRAVKHLVNTVSHGARQVAYFTGRLGNDLDRRLLPGISRLSKPVRVVHHFLRRYKRAIIVIPYRYRKCESREGLAVIAVLQECQYIKAECSKVNVPCRNLGPRGSLASQNSFLRTRAPSITVAVGTLRRGGCGNGAGSGKSSSGYGKQRRRRSTIESFCKPLTGNVEPRDRARKSRETVQDPGVYLLQGCYLGVYSRFYL
ncbi:unnamed protein product [Nesidiocoris tenuis]|uniref:Uncharacterized protein n=1 Tax=Nesidiocoris tenuis TaxID=355587 RepID=A0A6H5H6A8_9HEMI|nr:unnamed protein product [Nesidiocoris tenuis]